MDLKRIAAIAVVASFAACSSAPPPPPAPGLARARYATEEEINALEKQARANFERERDRQSVAVGGRTGPAPRISVMQPVPPPIREGPRVSMAEARYALQIGKDPSELTDGERAAARGY